VLAKELDFIGLKLWKHPLTKFFAELFFKKATAFLKPL